MKSHMVSNRGIAVLMVLWIIVLLTAVVFSFSVLVRTESQATQFFRESLEKRLIAEAGVERAVTELLYRGAAGNVEDVLRGEASVRVDGSPYTGQLGDNSYTYTVFDESGKIGLNLLTDRSGLILNRLLLNFGVSKEDADTIVDSVLDWKDGDHLHRLHGAETNYYMSLPNPYPAKDGRFDAVEELLMVKGITPEILYGSGEKQGIFNFVTVGAQTALINLNTAPRPVLAALPGITTEMADQIIALRQLRPLRTPEDIQPTVGEDFALVRPYIGVLESNAFGIESTGYRKGDTRGFIVKATVIIEGNSTYRYLYYKSPAGVKKTDRETVRG